MQTMQPLLVASFAFVFTCGCSDKVPNPPADTIPTTLAGCKGQLAKMKIKRDKLQLTLDRLGDRKGAAVARLKSMGVQSIQDLSKHPDARIDLNELRAVVSDMKPFKKDVEAYDAAINRLEAILREFDRKAVLHGGELTKEDREELSTAIHDSNDKLQPKVGLAEDLELESVLKQELGGTR